MAQCREDVEGGVDEEKGYYEVVAIQMIICRVARPVARAGSRRVRWKGHLHEILFHEMEVGAEARYNIGERYRTKLRIPGFLVGEPMCIGTKVVFVGGIGIFRRKKETEC